MNILIIEDDLDLQEGLKFSLSMDGYKVTNVETKKEGLIEIEEKKYDLVILDCNLPDGNGFELCEKVRSFSNIPILMLTARDTEIDEVKALELGVDDYMSKPFSLAVLKARIRRLLERKKENKVINSNGIIVDKSNFKVYKDLVEISCSKIEIKLLTYFMENRNQVITKDQILNYVWEHDGKFVDDNIISVNIRRLRTKIEDDPSNPSYIKTVYGIGYLWREV